MAEIEKKFLSGRMNKDVDKRLVADGEYLDAVNVSVNTSEGSTIGAAQNSLGNDLIGDISSVLAARGLNSIVNPIVIGALPFEAKNLIYWFVTSDNFDGIFEYNELTGDTILILGSTIGQLNFNRRHIITGVNYVYNPDGSLLFWTDGYNPPRRINIARCKTYNIDDPQINDDIDVVLRPPLSAPYIKLSNTDTLNLRPNNLEQKFLYFSYRFKYVDNEYSSMSPYSAVAFQPKGFAIDTETGENKGMVNIFNQANVTFETGNQFVKEIQLLVRDTSGLNVRIVDSFNKEELGISDNSSYEFTFMNNKTYAALPADQTTRLFDNVPLLASAQEIIGNRLIYGDYTQFRNIVSCNNEFININYKVDYQSEVVDNIPKQTFRSDRDYEVGIVYGDDYGRITTVLTSNDSNSSNANTNSVYIPPTNSSTANSLSVTINSPAPCWATNYRFFVKQAKSDYYNIFPRTFIKDGNYRYFLINEADRDKIIVNGYIIFKTFDNGPTHSNKQFKVLELEYKKADFVVGSNALEGLYFKIKAGPSDTFLYAPIQQVYSDNQSGRGPRPSGCGDNDTQNVVENRHLFAEGPIYYSGLNDNTIQNTGPTITANNSLSIALSDNRISIEILPGGSSFRWTWEVGQAWYIADLQISANPMTLVVDNNNKLSVSFSATSGYNPGDKFIFNLRGTGSYAGTPLQPTNGNRGLPPGGNPFVPPSYYLSGNTNQYGGHVILKGPGEIFPGAVISINILNDGPANSAPGQNASSMSWTSTQYYKDIEEWFWQSGAYLTFTQYDQNGNNINASAVTFRYGIPSTNTGVGITFPSNSIIQQNSGGQFGLSFSSKYMLIRGFGNNDGCTRNLIQAEIKVTQTPPNRQLIAETVPKESDLDIFHELSHTYPVDAGKHIVLWHYDTSTSDVLGTKLSNLDHKFPHYYSVGDMVYVRASNIPIGFYEVLLTPDRYTVVIDFAFPGTNQSGAISFNSTDQDQSTFFNAAKVIINNTAFKNSDYNAFAYGNGLESYRILDDFNAPRMDYSLRASTIIEDYEEEHKYASLTYSGLYRGDSSINRLNEFNLSLANFKNLDQSYGPVRKLFARDSDLLVLHQDKVTSVLYGKNLLVDAVGGGQVASVPQVLGNQIASQSEYGISDNPESFSVWSNNYYFADARRGAVLMMTGNDIVEISENGMRDYFIDFFSLSPNTQKLGGYDPHSQTYMISGNNILRNPCRTSITPGSRTLTSNTLGQSYLMFSLTSVTSWTVELVNLGFGVNWVDVPPYCLSGSGSQDIYANVQNNLTGASRSVKFVVRYCDQILEFVLTQGRGKETDISLIAFNKEP
jgi:hypothetical protein